MSAVGRSDPTLENGEYSTKSCSKKGRKTLATPALALAAFCSIGFVQGFLANGLVNVVITTIEKRFALKSADSGLIVSSYNIASILVLPFVAYVGGRGHKPRWVGWGVVILGLGSMVFSLPHFLAPRYDPKGVGEDSDLCPANLTGSVEADTESMSVYVYAFICAQVMIGIGKSGLNTLGLTYLDENVSQKSSSIYHGLYLAFSYALGPACGYLVGGALLKFFTNITERPAILTTSSAWIGAWWSGFVVAGPVLLLLAVPVLFLPRSLSTTRSDQRSKDHPVIATEDLGEVEKPKKVHSLSNFGKALLSLVRNQLFLLMVLANGLDNGLLAGFSTFTPKYLESMFGLNPTLASMYTGTVVIGGGMVGLVAGGLVVSKGDLNVGGILRLCLACTSLTIVTSATFLIKCPELSFAGATVRYDLNDTASLSSTDFSSSCNEQCICPSDVFKPVCGENGVTYFSPCFAGCNEKIGETYVNCTCITSLTRQGHLSAKLGSCVSKDCSNLPLFLCILFVAMFFTFMCWAPNLQIVMRVVPFEHRSLAVGIQWIFDRGLGGIPYPMMIGRFLDMTCSVWSTEDGKQTTCRKYFNSQMAFYLFIILCATKVVIFLTYSLGILAYKTGGKTIAEERRDRNNSNNNSNNSSNSNNDSNNNSNNDSNSNSNKNSNKNSNNNN